MNLAGAFLEVSVADLREPHPEPRERIGRVAMDGVLERLFGPLHLDAGQIGEAQDGLGAGEGWVRVSAFFAASRAASESPRDSSSLGHPRPQERVLGAQIDGAPGMFQRPLNLEAPLIGIGERGLR